MHIQPILERLTLYDDADLERLRMDVVRAKKGENTNTNQDLFAVSLADLRTLQLAINDEQDRRTAAREAQ